MTPPDYIKWGPKRMQSYLDALRDYIVAVRPIPGKGTTINETENGTAINAKGGSGASGSTGLYPFQIVDCGVVSAGDDTPMIGVNRWSYLGGSTIAGRLSESIAAWTTTDPGRFQIPAIGEKIWLEIKFTTGTVFDSATIKHGAVGGAQWAAYPVAWTINNTVPATPWQEYYNLLLAEVTDPTADLRPAALTYTIDEVPRQIVQIVDFNLRMSMWGINGLPMLIPEPAAQPGLAS